MEAFIKEILLTRSVEGKTLGSYIGNLSPTEAYQYITSDFDFKSYVQYINSNPALIKEEVFGAGISALGAITERLMTDVGGYSPTGWEVRGVKTVFDIAHQALPKLAVEGFSKSFKDCRGKRRSGRRN